MTHRWEAQCLSEDPFAGDYGGSGDSDGVLSDKMVTNRGGGACSTCGESCQPGTRNRVRSEVYDGEFMCFRWCVRCSFGMAVYDIRPSILDKRIEEARAASADTRPKGGDALAAPSVTSGAVGSEASETPSPSPSPAAGR